MATAQTTQTTQTTVTIAPAGKSSTAIAGTPTASVHFGTITVIAATPEAAWYARSEVTGLVAPFVALVVAIVAAYLALRNGLRLQAENKRNEFKLDVYREFGQKLDEAHEALSDVQFYVVFAAQEADGAEDSRALGIVPGPLRHHAKEFVDKFAAASYKVAAVMMLIERYLIIEPDLDVFKLALNCAVHDARQLQNSTTQVMFKWFPIKKPEGATGPEYVHVVPIPKDVTTPLQRSGWEFYNQASIIGSYLEDLRRELQILLLSGLFKGPVPKRQPIDPALRVVTLEKSELSALRKHFNEETAWGKQAAKTDREVREHFAPCSDEKPA